MLGICIYEINTLYPRKSSSIYFLVDIYMSVYLPHLHFLSVICICIYVSVYLVIHASVSTT